MADELAQYDRNFNTTSLGYDGVSDDVANIRTNAAGDAILVEAVAIVNEYKTAISGADTTPNYLEDKIVAGSNTTITKLDTGGNEQLEIAFTGGTSFYQTVQESGVSETQRARLNFVNYFTATDNAGNTSTDIDIDTAGLGNDSTLITTLTGNTTFLTNIANSSTFVNTLAINTEFIDSLVANAYFTTTLAGDTNFVDSLVANAYFITTLTSDPTFITDISTSISGSVSVVTDGVTITGDGTAGNPLVATAALSVAVNQVAHGFTFVGENIYCDGDNTYAPAAALNAVPLIQSNVVGYVSSIVDADNFTYTCFNPLFDFSAVPGLVSALTGTAGQTVWLSATTPGMMTLINPSSVSSTYLDIPVGTLLEDGVSMQYSISRGSGVSVLDVTELDDFANINTVSTVGYSGNFRTESATFVNRTLTELNHPGIARIEDSDNFRWVGFTSGTGTGTGLISTLNDFSFTYLARSIRAGASFDTVIGIGDGNAFSVYIRWFFATSPTFIEVYDGAGGTVTAVPIPTSNTWFTAVFDWVASTSTLNITVDGVSVFSGTPTFSTTNINPIFGNVSGTNGTFLDVDYVKTNYQVTR